MYKLLGVHFENRSEEIGKIHSNGIWVATVEATITVVCEARRYPRLGPPSPPIMKRRLGRGHITVVDGHFDYPVPGTMARADVLVFGNGEEFGFCIRSRGKTAQSFFIEGV